MISSSALRPKTVIFTAEIAEYAEKMPYSAFSAVKVFIISPLAGIGVPILTNPKRQRGRMQRPSLTLRASEDWKYLASR